VPVPQMITTGASVGASARRLELDRFRSDRRLPSIR
jgi:hypothetical protein